jgi:hypothetical protein
MALTIPGVSRPDDPFGGAINGTGDPTQSVYRPKRPRTATPIQAAPSGSVPGGSGTAGDRLPTPPNPADGPGSDGGTFDAGRIGTATGLQMPSFAEVQNQATRAAGAAQAAAAKAARTGGGTFDPAAPVAPVFSAKPGEATLLNPLGRATSGPQPPVVPVSAAAPRDASAPTAVPPGAAGAMTAVLPAVATAGPAVPAPAAFAKPPTVDQRVAADGGVKMPDGSYAFSNVPGAPGQVSKDTINRLANTNVVPAAAFTNPGLGVATSEATGGRVTPALGADNAITRPGSAEDAITAAYERAQADQAQARSDAQSDALSILNQDPRSPLGIAARNAKVELNSVGSGGGKAARTKTYLDKLGALLGGASAGVTGTTAAADTYQKDVAQQRIAAGNQAAETARAALQRPNAAHSQVTLADGTLGLLQPDGTVRPALGADGKAVKVAQTKPEADDKRQQAVMDAISADAGKLLQNAVTPGQTATPQQIAQARRLAAQQNGLAIAVGPDGNYYANVNGTPVRL